METVRPILEKYVDRTAGTFIEEKNYSLAWHYRNADPDLGEKRASELSTVLKELSANGKVVTELRALQKLRVPMQVEFS